MSIFLNAYRGRTVLVTGHTGFKGSWLSIWLNNLGAKVIGYSLAPDSEKGNFYLSGIMDKIVDIRGDIRDYRKLNEVFKKYRPDIVFHLAAQPLVRYSYERPRYTYEVNVIGTMNVLECIRQSKDTKYGIIVTSDKCYENKEWIWGYREIDAMGGYDIYSSSKGCTEILVSSYVRSYFSTKKNKENFKIIATVRAGNVIGGGDWAKDRIVPDCINSLENNEDILIRNPISIRPWQHVLEPLSGYLMLGEKMLENESGFGEAWNFGPKQDSIVNVEEVVKIIISYWGSGSYRCDNPKSEAVHEAKILKLDINKARNYLKWEPKWSVDTAVKKTIQWYKNYKTEDVYGICTKQIKEYCIEKG